MRKPSMKPVSVDVEGLRKALEAAFPDGRWLRLLEVFLPTGVADYGQMQRVTGLSRKQMDDLLERLAQLGGGSIVRSYSFGVPRPGVRGRPAAVYGLGEAGAALLRAAGHRDAAACGYEEVREVAHARAVLDVRLAAEAAGLVGADGGGTGGGRGRWRRWPPSGAAAGQRGDVAQRGAGVVRGGAGCGFVAVAAGGGEFAAEGGVFRVWRGEGVAGGAGGVCGGAGAAGADGGGMGAGAGAGGGGGWGAVAVSAGGDDAGGVSGAAGLVGAAG
jgi:hypothetical protein